MVAKVGTTLQFANGDQYEILQVEDTGETYIFTLNSDTGLCTDVERIEIK